MVPAQEEVGVVPLSLSVRNSLTFNRFIINPTFSFVREQNKYINIYNKREWVQFDDAPNTYLVGYNGRFAENIGAGISLFQQNYGVLTTFGGVVNFAYNARLTRNSNLTFGLNLAAYNSGVNTGSVVTNFNDPSLDDVPRNLFMTINPGINYGLAFIDLGVSINNLVAYNFKTSNIMEDNLDRGIQVHLMHTGYINSRGFFDQSKFSGLVRSEFKEDETILSATAMLTVPKGIWAQAGYNSVYGVSGGIGLNITSQIAIEYNFERALGDLTDFGPSHDLTLAYRFKNKQAYYYSSDDEIAGLITPGNKKRRPASKISREKAEENRKLAAQRKARIEAEKEEARLLKEQKVKEEAKAQAKLLAEQKAKEEAEAQAKLLAEQKAKEEAEEQAKLLAEQKAKEEAEAQAKLLAEQKAKEEAEEQAKLLAEQKAKEEAEAQVKLLAKQKAKEEAEEQAKLLAEQKAKEEAEEQAKLLAEQKAKEEAEAEAKLLQGQKDREEQRAIINEGLDKAFVQLTQETEQLKANQDQLLKKMTDIVEIKDQDLKLMKEENDLSDQGITVAPQPFKSVIEENARLNSLIKEFDVAIKSRDLKINELKNLYDDLFQADTILLDEVMLNYKNTITRLEAEQIKAVQSRLSLELRLEEINVATEIERNRRIKRAAFDNEDERYANDRKTLENIKQFTLVQPESYELDDFDFGEEQSSNIQILSNVNHTDNGYYLVIAVHSNVEKRNDFITKVVASGLINVDFFYDVNTSKYYIYNGKFESIQAATEALRSVENKPYNAKMSLVKIEN
jgi:type IX secretion system PorP/SprF family membrane protein